MPAIVVMPLLLSPLIYLSGRWRATAARVVTLAALAVIGIGWLLVARDLAGAEFLSYRAGMIAFYFDGLSLLISAVVLVLAALVTLYSAVEGEEGEEKYYALLLMMTGAVIGLVSAGDLFNLWLWFELTAISSYLLVAFYREETLAACAKYLIQTATGSILVLFGIALLFAQTGTLDLAQMQVPITPLLVVAGTLFIVGFGVKLALVPTYTWLPDAYAQAPTGITALLSGVVTISGLVALLRVLALMSGWSLEWGAALIGFGMLNIVIGNLLALQQTEVKRIFAYSSISHIGWMVLAVGIGVYAGQASGFYSGLLHLMTHAAMKALAFLAVGVVIYTRSSRRPLRVADLKGLAKRDPLTAIALVIACLSLGGRAAAGGLHLQAADSGRRNRNRQRDAGAADGGGGAEQRVLAGLLSADHQRGAAT